MRYHRNSGLITLNSGRRLNGHGGILGLFVDVQRPPSPSLASPLAIYFGRDGTIDSGEKEELRDEDDDEGRRLSAPERREIAEHMVARWREWGGV